jgi:RNA polymerase sporulation-specific sigma factor
MADSSAELAVGLESLCDEELVLLSRGGDNNALEYLMKKYSNMVRKRSRTYFLIGADRDDIVQEGMIGLFKAVRDYDAAKQSGFKAFAELCVTRQIITAVKTATRQKHVPLNTYISLNRPLFDEEYEITLMDILCEDKVTVNPEEIVVNRERFSDIELRMEEILSSFECKVLSCYLQGKSYQEIGAELEKDPKSIDNALQRIKRKVEKHISR